MLELLKNKLRVAANFPSPPAIALQIVALAGDPEIDVTRVATTISKDPVLTAKVLRVANSPLYSKRRKSENLRQALVVLGGVSVKVHLFVMRASFSGAVFCQASLVETQQAFLELHLQ